MRHRSHIGFCTFVLLLLIQGAQAAVPTQTLPVIYVNTANGQAITDKENYIAATVYIDPLATGTEALGSAQAPIATQVKGRGNWTWSGFDKKPYKLKFDAKQKMLGMPSNKHWCLMAGADDWLGFLRMPAGFRISEAVGLRWTPRTQPVELVLNGAYQGLYFLTEHVRIGSNRVNIEEQEDQETDEALITGGWLVEIDNYLSENNIEFNEGNGQHVMVSLKEPEVLSDQQRSYLVEQILGLNNALYGSSAAQLAEKLDLDEAAKYYLVQEIMEDCESYHGSCFLYKDRDKQGVADTWKFGPVWDFGNAYNRHQETWIYINPTWPQYWIGQLTQWPDFQRKVQEQWYIFYHDYKDLVRSDIRSYADRIEQAAKRDADVWRNTQNYCDNSNFEDVRDRFFRRYDWRIQWLYSQWGEGIRPVTYDIENPPLDKRDGQNAVKALHDGQLVIRIGDKNYSITGQEIR